MSRLSETASSSGNSAPHIETPTLSLEQRRALLRIARDSILSAFENKTPSQEPPSDPALSEFRGVFTSIYFRPDPAQSDLQLRGCVGYPLPIAPLYRAVAETARAAAFEDSRFPPLSAHEASSLEISLSVLSAVFPISPEAVEVGRHGLLISQDKRRGLLLPQVPVERGWDRETFLAQTCRKAGLPADAWRRSATIEAFTAEVLSDSDLVLAPENRG